MLCSCLAPSMASPPACGWEGGCWPGRLSGSSHCSRRQRERKRSREGGVYRYETNVTELFIPAGLQVGNQKATAGRDWKLVQFYNSLFPLQQNRGGSGHDLWPVRGEQGARDAHHHLAASQPRRLERQQRWKHEGPSLCGFLSLASQREASECGGQAKRGSKQFNKLIKVS